MSIALIANRGLHKRPGGWSPKELGTLSLWLDADDATTITISTGVSQWDDKSGNSRNVTQATGAAQPAWTKNGRNGRAVVTFDGTNHFLDGSDALDVLTGGLSVIAAYNATVNNRTIISKSVGAVTVNGEWAMFASSVQVYLGGSAVTTASTAATGVKVHSWVLDRSAGSTTWIDGTQTDTDTTSPFPNTTSYDIATAFMIGGLTSATTFRFSGDLFELIVSMSTLSTGNRQKAEGYLAHKWGTTSALPSDHPYKSVCP